MWALAISRVSTASIQVGPSSPNHKISNGFFISHAPRFNCANRATQHSAVNCVLATYRRSDDRQFRAVHQSKTRKTKHSLHANPSVINPFYAAELYRYSCIMFVPRMSIRLLCSSEFYKLRLLGHALQRREYLVYWTLAEASEMKKSELLRAMQNEIQRHNSSTFMSEEHKIVQTGCSACQKHFGTVEQFKRHVTEDVLPPLLNRLSSEGKN